jgi:hypothetical protein
MLVFFIGAGLSGDALAKEESKEEERAEVRKMVNETLDSLYKEQPSARKVVEEAAGYGVFSNFGLKIFVLGSGKGKGVVINKKEALVLKNSNRSGCFKARRPWMVLSIRDGSLADRQQLRQRPVIKAAIWPEQSRLIRIYCCTR